MAGCMNLPVASGNGSRRLKLLHGISIMSPPNTNHAGLGHLIPGRHEFYSMILMTCIFFTNPACYVPHPSIFQKDAKKCERCYCALSMGCIRDVIEDGLRNTTGKSVNPAAFRLTVVWSTFDYQQWNICPVSSKICSVFERNQVCHKTVKINTEVNRTLLIFAWPCIIDTNNTDNQLGATITAY